MKKIHLQQHPVSSQKGTVLLIALIFLLALTILAMNAMDTTVLETRLAANNQERNFAFRVAEIGVLQAIPQVANIANITTLAGDQVIDVPEVTNIERDHNLLAETTRTQIIYKGTFLAPRGENNSGQNVMEAYFEVQTTGLSTQTHKNPVSTQLRYGVIRPVIKGSGSTPFLLE